MVFHAIRLFRASFLAFMLFQFSMLPQSALAQVAGGTISGTVTDGRGGVIPHAEITITNVETGIGRSASTNEVGRYITANLLPGRYDVKFLALGFKTEVKTGIALTVGAEEVVDLTMQVGASTETVQVTSEAPAIQLATSDISAVVNATTVRELPLNGRSWTDLATLQPGVNAIQTQPTFAAGTDRGNRGFGQQLTISGARPQQNNYRLDGVSINDYSNGAPGSVLGGNLGVDAIQEFSVLTSNYSAEYGKTSGGVINAITRSGTNEIHGSVYEFLRNSALDARNFFDADKIPPFKRNQFGGAVGGPIIENRTFFFADYEGIRQSKGITSFTTVPSVAARSGSICSVPQGADPANPCTPTQVVVDPAAASYFTFYHLPNGPVIGNGDVGVYTFPAQQLVNENFLTTRVDHKLSENDSLFGTYVFDRTPYSSPDGLNNVQFDTLTARQIVALEETHTFGPRFANSVRLGYNHEKVNNNESIKAINPDAARSDLGVGGSAFAGRDAAQVFMSGVTPFTGGVGGSPTYFYHWNSFQAHDDALLSKGAHSIKFGGTVERMSLNQIADTDPNGIWKFGTVQDFLTNNPSKFQGGIASTLSPRNLRDTIFGLYLQDDWRWRPNLTLNLGLRYEMATMLTETRGKLSNLRNLSDASPHLGSPFFSNPTLKNFEPRVGFAWDPFRNGKTAVRGGVGMFDVLPLAYQFILLTNQAAPFFSYTSVNNPGPGTFYSGLTNFPANTLRASYVEPNPKRNYVMQWNLNVQQELTPSLAAMVAYVGSRGIHQPFRVDESNYVLPTKTSAGYLWPKVDVLGNIFTPDCNQTDPNLPEAAGSQCAPPQPLNPNFGSVRAMLYRGHSYYNALETQLAKRLNHGFQVQGTFTWAKSMDTSSASGAGDSFGNSISSLPWFDLKLNRGLSDFNVGRTFVLNGTWELPSSKSLTGPVGWAAHGWELGLIYTLSDGVPFTGTWGTGSDPLGSLSSDDWDVPNRLGGSGCSTLTNPGNPLNYIKTNCFAVPVAPSQAFFDSNCDPAPPSLGAALGPGDLRCFNLRGNAGRNILNGPGLSELDFSVFKNNYIRSISEHFNIQFRAEIFNILNRTNFAPPVTPDNTDIFDGTGAATGVSGLLSRTTTTAREIQFAIKVVF
jgi:Carboxypeptidase regulatory-like domain/TonB-dependent Receptor Plug Domain/TonB dependent receptor